MNEIFAKKHQLLLLILKKEIPVIAPRMSMDPLYSSPDIQQRPMEILFPLNFSPVTLEKRFNP